MPAGTGASSFVDVGDIAAAATLARVTGDVEKLSGRRPTSLADYARDHREALNA